MAVSALFPALWSARITYFAESVSTFLPNATRAWEGEAVYGNIVKIPTVQRDVVIRDYSRTADLAVPEDIDATTQDLSIDQEKYFNFALEDLDARQSRIPGAQLIDIKAAGAGIALAQNVDAYVAGRLTAIANNAWGRRDVASAPAQFNINVFSQIKKFCNLNGLDWRQMVIVTTPEILEVIENNFLGGTYGDALVSGYIGREAAQGVIAAGGGVVMRIAGMQLAISPLAALKSKKGVNNFAATNADRGNRSLMWVYDPRDLALVMQVNKVETYRQEARFGTGVKGLMNYGSKVLNAGRMQEILIADVAAGT